LKFPKTDNAYSISKEGYIVIHDTRVETIKIPYDANREEERRVNLMANRGIDIMESFTGNG